MAAYHRSLPRLLYSVFDLFALLLNFACEPICSVASKSAPISAPICARYLRCLFGLSILYDLGFLL